MRGLEAKFFRALEILLVFLLAGMVVMVFGNVILRWTTNSGILFSEEMSRYFFVWLTFIGAVVVARENAHLGVDALVRALGPKGRFFCMVLGDALVLICCIVFFWGTWRQAPFNYTNVAPVTGINMLWVFGVGFFTSIGIGTMTLARLARALSGSLRPGELDAFAGIISDDDVAHSIKGRLE
jgi:TRAP-type C4-dicarboxylate transport system permease small subunit